MHPLAAFVRLIIDETDLWCQPQAHAGPDPLAHIPGNRSNKRTLD